MTSRNPSDRWIPALFTAVGDVIGDHFKEITAITGTLGGSVAILDSVFGIRLVPYGTALVEFLTSDGFITTLLLMVLISQVLLYQRVEWIVTQLEPQDDLGEQDISDETSEEPDEVLTDGGSSRMPPRDDKGRFTTQDSGSSNLFLLALAAITGYVFGAETGALDPVAGALIAVAIISFVQATDN